MNQTTGNTSAGGGGGAGQGNSNYNANLDGVDATGVTSQSGANGTGFGGSWDSVGLGVVVFLVVQQRMVVQVAEASLGMVSWGLTEVTLAAVILMVLWRNQ